MTQHGAFAIIFPLVLFALVRLDDPCLAASDWPQWRGPLGDGSSADADPPLTWSESSNIRWKVKLPGSGMATPIISGDRVFIQTAIPSDKTGQAPASQPVLPAGLSGMIQPASAKVCQFVLMCLDRQTGKTIWQKVAREDVPHEGHHRDGSYASGSPCTDGKLVFAFFGSRGLYCYDVDGNLKWQKDLGRMNIKMSFGEGATPVLFGDRIIVNWDHEGECFIAAFDKETGKELWRQARDEQTSWATPLVVQHQGQTQVIVAATRKIRGYDFQTGKQLWQCGGMTANVIPCPVAGDGIVYAASGFRGAALLAIRLGRGGDLDGTDAIAWKLSKNTPYVPSPLLYNGRLYFFNGNNGTLSCYEAASGKPLIDAHRLDDLAGVYASPVGAAGRVYLTGRNGTSIVIKCSDKLEVLATNHLDESFTASPALAGKDFFLRGREYLYCVGSATPPQDR